MICCNSITRRILKKNWRKFVMARSVRQGCLASVFLFAMALDPIFRWLEDAIIPRNLGGLDFLQLAQCAYADDLAVATTSAPDFLLFRALVLMTLQWLHRLSVC